MPPFDEFFAPSPSLPRSSSVTAPAFAPVVDHFDPSVEKLVFALSEDDEDATLVLRDLIDGSGVQVELSGRTLATLMGCTADDIPEGCLTFDFED